MDPINEGSNDMIFQFFYWVFCKNSSVKVDSHNLYEWLLIGCMYTKFHMNIHIHKVS